MNVKELIELLKGCDQEATVLVASDEEGNSYHLLSEAIGEANFDVDGREITPYYTEWSAQDCCMDDEEYENMRELPKAIVIGP
jgi:hypothetical protein